MEKLARRSNKGGGGLFNVLQEFYDNPSVSIFIRDLPYSCTSDILEQFFKDHLQCEIKKTIILSNDRGQSLQYGCMMLGNEDEVEVVIEVMNKKRFRDRDIR
jgi:RNA recognition motif-containing protein